MAKGELLLSVLWRFERLQAVIKHVPNRVQPKLSLQDAPPCRSNGLIHSANVKATVTLLNVDRNSDAFRKNYRELHWTRRGGIERLAIHRTIPAAAAPAAGNPDQATLADAMFFLQLDYSNNRCRNCEIRVLPGAPSAVTHSPFQVSAYEASLSRWHPDFEIHYDLCLRFFLNAHDETRTLKQIVDEWPTEYREVAEVDGVKCEVIRALHPAVPPTGATPVEFYVDRQAGAMIRRIVVYHPTGQLVRTVTKFHRGANGEVLPLQCDSGFRPNDLHLATKARTTRVSITSYTITRPQFEGAPQATSAPPMTAPHTDPTRAG